MRGFRQALHSVGRFANNAFAHGRRAVMQIDRTIGGAAKLYHSLAPQLAPVAKELFGEGKTSMVHQAISSGLSNYENVRGKVQRAHRMADSKTRSVKKEIPSLGLE